MITTADRSPLSVRQQRRQQMQLRLRRLSAHDAVTTPAKAALPEKQQQTRHNLVSDRMKASGLYPATKDQ